MFNQEASTFSAGSLRVPNPLVCITLALGYFCTAQFSVYIASSQGYAHIWPASGIGLAAIYLCGLRIAPAIFLADFCTAFITGQPLDTALLWSGGNAIALAVSGTLLRRYCWQPLFHEGAKGMVLFTILGPFLASLISVITATIGTIYTSRAIPAEVATLLWGWFLSDFSGIIMITPFLVSWLTQRNAHPERLLRRESLLLYTFTAAIMWGIFASPLGTNIVEFPFPFALLPFLAWATFRLDIRSLTLMLFTLSGYSLLMTLAGGGPFAQFPEPHGTQLLQLFISGIITTSLIIHAILQERSRAENALRRSKEALEHINERLEERVAERTDKLSRALSDLRTAGDIYRNIFHHAVDGIFQTDGAGNLTHTNTSFAHIIGYDSPRDALDGVGNIFSGLLTSPDEGARLLGLLETKGVADEFDFLGKHATDEEIWLAMSIRATKDEAGSIRSLNGIVRNITERKRCEESLTRRAMHDELTGIANRYIFHESFAQALSLAKRKKRGLALLYIDLDDFKKVNDAYGHMAGDTVLVEAVRRMKGRLRKSDLIARLGGDEFAILLPEAETQHEAQAVAEAILSTLSNPFSLPEADVVISASIGGSIYPQDGTTAEALVKHADSAMYESKRAGKSIFRLHEPKRNA